MSWQGYVDNLMATKSVTACGIFGLDGSPWASTPDFPLSVENIKTVVASISDSSKVASGLNIGADRYILLRNDPSVSIILKKGANGIVAYKSAQCCIIGVHDLSAKTEAAVTAIGRVIDYLSKHGY